jgi:hypothetical protein
MILLFFTGCEQKEDNEIFVVGDEQISPETIKYETITSREIDELSISAQNEVKNKTTKFKFTPDFNNLSKVLIQNTNEYMTVVPGFTNIKHIETTLNLIKYEGEVVSTLVHKVKKEGGDSSKFTGFLWITTIDGGFLNGYRIYNDQFVSQFVEKSKFKKSDDFVYKEAEVACVEYNLENDFDCENTLGEVVLTAPPKGATLSLLWIPATHSYAYTYPSGSGGGGGGSASTGYPVLLYPCDDPIHGCDHLYEPDYVINNLTNPCANNIFTELVLASIEMPFIPNITVGSPVTFSDEIIQLFLNSQFVGYKIENVTFTDIVPPNARTTTENRQVVTRIHNGYLSNATDLSIARTMIHELVHSYILHEMNRTGSFTSAVNAYASEHGFNPYGTPTEKMRFQHEFMGQYVKAMAGSLKYWNEHYGSGLYISDSYYYSMAFGGLFYIDSNGNQVVTDSFLALVPDKTERDRIINILINEQNGVSNYKGKKCP